MINVYTTESQAAAFVAAYNSAVAVSTGRVASMARIGANQYAVWLTEAA